MSTPSSSSSSSIYPWKYGIFLSFSGEDTRKTFTDHLYGALNRFGINSFRDVDNLERGKDIAPELLQAIGESWGSIVVFSERYGYSTWCLDELAEIVKQRKARGHQVFPIFYHVEPSHLRKQSESIREAFAKHEERFKENKVKIQRWRDALSEVASIGGWPIDDQYELNFIVDIVKEIFTKLFETCSHWKELHSKLNIGQDEDVRVIGICGTGGIGKAAFARVVYTQMSPYFEAKSFLADVGEVSINNGLVSLQKQLLSQILPEGIFIFSNIQEGRDIISRTLCQKKVLIVMDDVDNIQQLKCVVEKREWFGLGSKIIITTKEELLQSLGVDDDDVCKLTTRDAASTVLVSKESLINVDQNFNTLKRKLEKLNAVKKDNESKKSIQLQPKKKLKKEVELWFQNVERLNGEILNDLETKATKSNIFLRGFVGANVLNRIPEVEELIQQGRSFTGLVIDDYPWVGQVLRTTDLLGEGAVNVLKNIWACLMDDGISKIGVWGMGGTGKTTIMKLINNKLLEEKKKFQSVIWVTVSKETNIAKLQNDIACAINISLPEDDETRRAGKLYEMLVRRDKYVLILDDLWDKFSLEEVGIPEPSNGSKLLVTTRLLKVCRFLVCQEIEMPTLSKPDAWSLFSKKVGEDVLNCPDPDLLPIVESVAEECGGLPLAIVTIAGSMKGVLDIHEWQDALYALSRQIESVNGMEEKVFQRLQFSYDRLQNEKEKHCFLCCALYPEDCRIYANNLIELWIAEGYVEKRDSRQAKIDKGHTILNKLKDCCLLLDGYNGFVQMHDLMRDMALRITKVGPRFLVRAGMQLSEIPDVLEWNEDLEKVSLMWNHRLQIPSQMPPPKCPKLTTLLLSQCNIKSIPECFFEQMHGLKILDLSWNPIKSLPESISNLETLTTLLLRCCYSLEKVPSFSKLQALEKLDLLRTNIKHLPHGMERLVNLKYLDLSGTSVTEITDGRVVKYTSLQYLAVTDFSKNVCRFMRGEEIGGMRNLEFFKGRFYDLNEWDSYIQALNASIKRPRRYYIGVGPREEAFFRGGQRKYIGLNACEIICTNGFKVLFDVEYLNIWECIVNLCEEKAFFSWFNLVPHKNFSSLSIINIEACRNIKKLFSSNWVLQNLQNLYGLQVADCKDMEEIIASESGWDEEEISAIKLWLPKLNSLRLSNLPELKSICSEAMVCDSIRFIDIVHCPKLKRIPLNLPLHDDGQPYPPPIEDIYIFPKEKWELLEWDQSSAKSLLKPYVRPLY